MTKEEAEMYEPPEVLRMSLLLIDDQAVIERVLDLSGMTGMAAVHGEHNISSILFAFMGWRWICISRFKGESNVVRRRMAAITDARVTDEQCARFREWLMQKLFPGSTDTVLFDARATEDASRN